MPDRYSGVLTILSKQLRRYILFLLLIIFLAVEVPILAVGQLTQPRSADTLIVLGAKLIGSEPSTMLRLRLEEALKLYRQGYAPHIIVSGARGYDEDVSEAYAMKAYLVNHGIPPEAISIEDRSFSTMQNLRNSKTIMTEKGWSTAIVVSNASHIRRALVIAGQLEMNVTGAAAPMADNPYLTAKQYLREGAAMLVLFIAP